MKEPQPGQRFDLTASLEDMEVNPKGEFALASDLDEALDLLQRWKNRKTHGLARDLWMDTTICLKKHGRQLP